MSHINVRNNPLGTDSSYGPFSSKIEAEKALRRNKWKHRKGVGIDVWEAFNDSGQLLLAKIAEHEIQPRNQLPRHNENQVPFYHRTP